VQGKREKKKGETKKEKGTEESLKDRETGRGE
jgi:hypothetical protein